MSILYLSCYLLSLLPLRLLYFISDLLYLVIYYAAGYRRKVVAENLAGGLANKTAQERNEIAKAFYHHLCDLLLEHIKALTIKRNVLLQRVTIDKIEIIRRFYERGQSIILVSGHFGNWEWVANGLALQTSYAICAGYQPLRNKGIDQLVRRIRSRFRRKALPITSLLRHIKGYTGPPQAITLLIDQAPLYKGSSYATTFLGQPTNVALTAAKVAQKLNQPLFYIEIERIKRGSYQARPVLLAEVPGELSAEEIAERYTRRLERDILRNPAFWLWSHKRWKGCKLDKNA